jgi:hypothetical membrane protein
MKRYILSSMAISMILLLLFNLGNESIFSGTLHDLFPSLVLFSFLQSLIILQIISLGQRTNWKSPTYALGTITVRLITSLIFLVVLGLKGVTDIKSLGIQFIAIYLIYLTFELNAVLANLRQN